MPDDAPSPPAPPLEVGPPVPEPPPGTPEAAREKVFTPALGVIVVGILGVFGMLVAAAGVVLEWGPKARHDDDDLTMTAYLGLTVLGIGLFSLVIAGGRALMRLRRYRLADAAVGLVAILSLGGLPAAPFYLFGFWALVLLHRPDVWGHFHPPPRPRARARRRPAGHDLRADYDDEFGRVRTPAERARRRLTVLGYLFMGIGVLGTVGALLGAAAIVIEFIHSAQDESEWAVGGFFVFLTLIGAGLGALVFAGGWYIDRRRRLALAAAYVVTGLSLAGPYGVPFFPIGLWALVFLHQPEVWRQAVEARRVVKPPTGEAGPDGDPEEGGASNRALACLVAGGAGLGLGLILAAGIAWDSYTEGGWEETDLVVGIGLSLIGACLSGLLAVRGVYLLRTRG